MHHWPPSAQWYRGVLENAQHTTHSGTDRATTDNSDRSVHFKLNTPVVVDRWNNYITWISLCWVYYSISLLHFLDSPSIIWRMHFSMTISRRGMSQFNYTLSVVIILRPLWCCNKLIHVILGGILNSVGSAALVYLNSLEHKIPNFIMHC